MLSALPETFTAEGLLLPGDYPLTLEQLSSSMLVLGASDRATTWDSGLADGSSSGIWACSSISSGRRAVSEVFIDGSFVEDKDHPNDIDGYFVCELSRLASGELERSLNLLDPCKCWTWDPAQRRPFLGYPKKQLPMWHEHRVELYPHFGQLSGLRDQYGNELEFPSAFRLSRRDGKLRGIVQVIRGKS